MQKILLTNLVSGKELNVLFVKITLDNCSLGKKEERL